MGRMTTHRSDRVKTQAALTEAQAGSLLLTRPGFLIRRLHQIHTALFIEETARFELTPFQYSLLSVLDAEGEMDQNSLALAVGLERSSVAEVLPRLQARGLLARRVSPDDGRVRLVSLTRESRALLKRMAAAAERAHARTIEALPASERDQFMLQMVRLVKAHNDSCPIPMQLP
jgi:DNA-binding MarR family transcriptional regulator